MTHTRRVLAALFYLVIGSTAVTARANEVIAVDVSNPPFMYAADGKAVGIYPALLREVYRRLKTPVEITPMPWKRVLEGAESGAHGAGGLYKNDQRLAKFDFSDQLFVETMRVYVAKAKPITFTDVASLKGKTVGVIRGWSYGSAFDDAVKAGEITAEPTASDEQNFSKLAAGRLDAVLAIPESAHVILSNAEFANKIEGLSPPLFQSPTFVAFAKTAGKIETLRAIDAALAAMHADGSYDKIVSSIGANQ